MDILTQQQISATYWAVLAGLDPQTNTTVTGTDWWFKGNALGAVMSNAYRDLSLIENQNFVQYMNGNQLDLQVAELNITPRNGGTLATGIATLPSTQMTDTTIPFNTILFNGQLQYYVRQTTTVLAGQLGEIPIASQNTGDGQQLLSGSQLQLQIPIGSINYFLVDTMTDGSDVESNNNLLKRILYFMSNPIIAGTAAAYENSLLTQPNITGAYSESNIIDDGVLSLFALSGTNNPDVILENPAIMYSRTTSDYDLTVANNYIQSIRLALDVIQLATTETYYFDGSIAPGIVTVQVQLATNYTLATEINGITVEDLIKREVRRAFITQPLLATATPPGQFILLKSIQESLDIGLNSINGIYAPCLVNRVVLYDSTPDDIPVPTAIQPSGNLYLVYDIDYGQIDVQEIT